MTKEDVLQHEVIWGLLCGRIMPNDEHNTLMLTYTDKIIEFKDEGFICQAYLPGNQLNIFKYEDYKKTWCFNPNEMPERDYDIHNDYYLNKSMQWCIEHQCDNSELT